MINIQYCFQINGVFQLCLCPHSSKPFNKIRLFVINASHNNVGISNINR